MRLLRVLALTIAALVVSTPGVSQAEGIPFDGTAIVPWKPSDATPYVVVPQGPAEVPVPIIVQTAPPPEPPAPDPKFVFPPTPTAPEPPGSQTVIIQRGSKIEVQSFSAAR